MSTATLARRGARRSTSKRTTRESAADSGDRFDPYQAVTDRIIELLEAGTAPWHKPWNTTTGLPRSLSTGKPYRGINPFLLQCAAIAAGYESPWWGTYDQIKERGGQVRKGEHGTLIVFWKRYVRKAKTPDEEDRQSFVLRTYKVFNAEQADGLVSPPAPGSSPREDVDPIAECEQAIARYLANGGPELRHGGGRAFYSPPNDVVTLPHRSAFDSSAVYYGTAFHELVHSTGHKSRLARPNLLNFHHFGDPDYSEEELTAEMGSAFLAAMTGIDAVTLPNSAAYLASWLKVLRSDSKMVVTAAGRAQRAADLILGVKHGNTEE